MSDSSQALLAVSIFVLGIILIVALMIRALIKGPRHFKSKFGISFSIEHGVKFNPTTIDDEIHFFYDCFTELYGKKLDELFGRMSIKIESEKIKSSLRFGKEKEYFGLTFSPTKITLGIGEKTFIPRKTALLWEIHNACIWEFYSYQAAITEGDLENAKKFMNEVEALAMIKKREEADIIFNGMK